MTKFIFVTGGVLSSLGKGITSASIATILKQSGFKVSMLKIDPYLNVDPGTMSPLEHGEVFVTADGAETDLDLGNYERFIDKTFCISQYHRLMCTEHSHHKHKQNYPHLSLKQFLILVNLGQSFPRQCLTYYLPV